MSRISGIRFWPDVAPSLEHLEKMQSICQYSDHWTADHHLLKRVVFGWTGWHTPQLARDEQTVVCLDGMIYNRDELGGSENDTELIFALFRQYDFPEVIRRLNGDFAIALYDQSSDSLWLARDRFGVKPLYFTFAADFGFAFSSRPCALLSLPGVHSDVNRRYVAIFAGSHYRYFDNHLDESPYAEINQLPPGHILLSRDRQISIQRYWMLEDEPDFTGTLDELAQRYCSLLEDAIAIRYQSLSRPAFTLSGGMDSSSVLSFAVHATGSKQHAFSTVYHDKTYDESGDIRTILDSAVAQWHPTLVDNPDVFATIRRMVACHDEPVATATWLSHFLLAEQVAKQGFSGLLGGLGGDELNAGEYEYFPYFFADLRLAGKEEQLQEEIWWWVHYHDHPIYRKGPDVVEAWFERLINFREPNHIYPDRQRLERYVKALNPDYFDLSTFNPIMEHPFSSYLKNRTYQDLTRETMPCCLRAEDRQTTACGLDHALPFLDHRVVEFMYRVPGMLKYEKGVTKHLLREATRGILSESTRTRIKKTGWNAPGHLWFLGQGKDALLDLIHSTSFRKRGIYNLDEIDHLIHEHEEVVSTGAARENHMMFLWQLVNLELWFNEYIDQ